MSVIIFGYYNWCSAHSKRICWERVHCLVSVSLTKNCIEEMDVATGVPPIGLWMTVLKPRVLGILAVAILFFWSRWSRLLLAIRKTGLSHSFIYA